MNLSIHRINNFSEVRPLYEDAPERFKRFYDAVYLLLSKIPEGGMLKVADHCTPSSYEMFIKCTCLCMLEERINFTTSDAMLEFLDEEYTVIRRGYKFVKSVVKPHFYSSR